MLTVQQVMNQFWSGFNHKLELTKQQFNNEDLYENLLLVFPISVLLEPINEYPFFYHICLNENYYNHPNFDKVLKLILETLVIKFEVVQNDRDSIQILKDLLINHQKFPELKSPFLRLIETKNFQSAHEMLHLYKRIFEQLPGARSELANEIKNLIHFQNNENEALKEMINGCSDNELITLFQMIRRAFDFGLIGHEEFAYFIKTVDSKNSISIFHNLLLDGTEAQIDDLLKIYKYILFLNPDNKNWMHDILVQKSVLNEIVNLCPIDKKATVLYYIKECYKLGILSRAELLQLMQKELLQQPDKNIFLQFLEQGDIAQICDLFNMFSFMISLDKKCHLQIKRLCLLPDPLGMPVFFNALNDSSFDKEQKLYILIRLDFFGWLEKSDLMYDLNFYFHFFPEDHPENVFKLLLGKKYYNVSKIFDNYQKMVDLNHQNILFLEEHLFARDDNHQLFFGKILDLASANEYPIIFNILKKCYDWNIFTDYHMELLLNRHFTPTHPFKFMFFDHVIEGSKFESYLNEIQFGLANDLSLFYNLGFIDDIHHDGKIQSRLLDQIILYMPENLTYYLKLIYVLLVNRLISRDTFADLVLKHKDPYYSPLHELLYRKEISSLENFNKYINAVSVYLKFIEDMVEKGELYLEECKDAIFFENTSGFFTVHQAFNGFSIDVTKRFWSFCEKILDSETQFWLLKGRFHPKNIWCKEDKLHSREVNKYKLDLIRNLHGELLERIRLPSDDVFQQNISPNSVAQMSLFSPRNDSPNDFHNQNGLTKNNLFNVGM